MRFHQLGFSTAGCLVAAALGVASLAAAPGVGAYMNETRVTRDADAFLATLKLAQSEAIKRETAVAVAATGSGWDAWEDGDRDGKRGAGEAMVRSETAARGARVAANAPITFLPSGFADLDATASRTFHFCGGDGPGRSIRISATGTLRIAAHDCRG